MFGPIQTIGSGFCPFLKPVTPHFWLCTIPQIPAVPLCLAASSRLMGGPAHSTPPMHSTFHSSPTPVSPTRTLGQATRAMSAGGRTPSAGDSMRPARTTEACSRTKHPLPAVLLTRQPRSLGCWSRLAPTHCPSSAPNAALARASDPSVLIPQHPHCPACSWLHRWHVFLSVTSFSRVNFKGSSPSKCIFQKDNKGARPRVSPRKSNYPASPHTQAPQAQADWTILRRPCAHAATQSYRCADCFGNTALKLGFF